MRSEMRFFVVIEDSETRAQISRTVDADNVMRAFLVATNRVAEEEQKPRERFKLVSVTPQNNCEGCGE